MPKKPSGIDPKSFVTFGELLHYLRERAHLSQRDLAARAGYHFSFISYLEKNTRSLDEASLLGRFVPALEIEDEPHWVERLLELSKVKKGDLPLDQKTKKEQRIDNLPISLTSIIGREYETARLKKMLLAPEKRLLSVIGPPGVGKTRLALHVARMVQPAFRDGVVFVDLIPVRVRERLYPVIASGLGVLDKSKGDVRESIREALTNKQILLILDNFEQIIDSGPDLLDLMSISNEIKILVTSREVLRLRGEQEFHLSPLPLPLKTETVSFSELQQIPSISLFVERAQAVHTEFKLDDTNALKIAEICTRLDGLPLAIELAAARARTLSINSMLEQMERRFDWLSHGARDLPLWRQSLQNAIAWSVNALSEQERALFQRLSIFTGGWTLAAVIEVCSDDLLCKQSDVFDLLIQLMDKSLVLPEDENGRFNFLETLREFSSFELIASTEYASLQEKHCSYFLAFAKDASSSIKQGGEELLWLNLVEKEYDNLQQALTWAIETRKDPALAMELGTSIHIFWLTRGYLTEARSWLTKILALDSSPTIARSNLLRFASDYASAQGDFSQANLFEEEAMSISQVLGDEMGIYSSMDGIAMMAGMNGDYARAAELLEKVLVYRKKTGDPVALMTTLNNFALATRLLGDAPRAILLYEEAIEISRKEGIKPSLARALNGLAEIHAKAGDYQKAFSLLRDSILIRHQLSDLKGLVASLSSIAFFAEKQGDKFLAAKLEGAASRIREEIGAPIEPGKQADSDALLHRLRMDLGEERFQSAWGDGKTMSQKQMIELIENFPLATG